MPRRAREWVVLAHWRRIRAQDRLLPAIPPLTHRQLEDWAHLRALPVVGERVDAVPESAPGNGFTDPLFNDTAAADALRDAMRQWHARSAALDPHLDTAAYARAMMKRD